MRGIRTNVPTWLMILEAADHDPLRAQEIEDQVTARWWHRWLAWREEYGKEQERQSRKAKRRR